MRLSSSRSPELTISIAVLKLGLVVTATLAVDLFTKRAGGANSLRLGASSPFATTIPIVDAITINERATAAQDSRSAFDKLRYSLWAVIQHSSVRA
jgi:hypothetical protein